MEIVTYIVFEEDVISMLTVICKCLETVNMRASNFIEVGAVEIIAADDMVITEKTCIVAITFTILEKPLYLVSLYNPIASSDSDTCLAMIDIVVCYIGAIRKWFMPISVYCSRVKIVEIVIDNLDKIAADKHTASVCPSGQ
jgi:hypothetical protein